MSVNESPEASMFMAQEWRKWGAPHFRHYGERYKMVREDSKPAKPANYSSILSPFYH
jgi:hypothetical protein